MHLKELCHWPDLDKKQTVTGSMVMAGRQMRAVLSGGGEKSVAMGAKQNLRESSDLPRLCWCLCDRMSL